MKSAKEIMDVYNQLDEDEKKTAALFLEFLLSKQEGSKLVAELMTEKEM